MLTLFRNRCRSVRRMLWEYAAERLSEGPMETVERHLSGCARCRRELDSLRQAQCLLTAYRHREPPSPRSNWAALREQLIAEGAHSAVKERSRALAGERNMVLLPVARQAALRNSWLPQLKLSMVGGVAVAALAFAVLTHYTKKDGDVSVTPDSAVASHFDIVRIPSSYKWPSVSETTAEPMPVVNHSAKTDPETKLIQAIDKGDARSDRSQARRESIENSDRIASAQGRRENKQARSGKLQFHSSDPGSRLEPPTNRETKPKSFYSPDDMLTVSNTPRGVMGSLQPMSRDDDMVY